MSSSSFYERNIWAFIQVLKHQPDLFSEQDRADLNELNKALTKDVTQISKAVKTWLKSHPKIFKEYVEILDELCKSETCRGAGGQPAPPPPPEGELRKKLTNAIRAKKPAATQPKPNSDEKSK
jgi:hypothetical protein